MNSDVLERVRLTLVGFADGSGRIERWSASDAYAVADVSREEFERNLAILEHNRELTIDKARAKRRFQLSPVLMQRKADADRYVTQARRGAPAARALTIDNLSRIDGGNAKRLRFDLTIEGVGTIEDCVFVLGDRPFVAGPSRREGTQFRTLVRFDKALAQEVRLSIERRIAGDPTILQPERTT